MATATKENSYTYFRVHGESTVFKTKSKVNKGQHLFIAQDAGHKMRYSLKDWPKRTSKTVVMKSSSIRQVLKRKPTGEIATAVR